MKGEEQSRGYRNLGDGKLRRAFSTTRWFAGRIATGFSVYSGGLGLNRPDHSHHCTCSCSDALLNGEQPARIRLQRSASKWSAAPLFWRTCNA